MRDDSASRRIFHTIRGLRRFVNWIMENGYEIVGASFDLYIKTQFDDLQFTGCRSCFACKIKGSKTGGGCALRDDFRPILEYAWDADYSKYKAGMFDEKYRAER